MWPKTARMVNTYDYVIVGAGSAGCVLANKLSAEPANRVLLLEAGPMDRNLMIHIPAGVYKAYKNPRLNWNYESAPEPDLQDRRIYTPRGRVVGGSSSINSMVYMRGHPWDYDAWASELGLTEWSFDRCLPYFKAGETSDRGADEWRGGAGPLGVTQSQLKSTLIDAFLDSGEQAGQGRSNDLNGYQPEGVARLDATRWNGRRCSAAVAHLKPALKRKNLTLLTRAMVRQVVIENGRATGLVYDHRGMTCAALADREVILAGGAINSPQLLMVSGIGPADQLAEHGIKVAHDAPEVGKNLQDHSTTILQIESLKPASIDWVGKPHWKLAAGMRWLAKRKGIATTNIWEAGGLVRGNASVQYPNLQYHFAPVGFEFEGRKIKLKQAFGIHIDVLRPTSRGAVSLISANPFAKPHIQFNYMQTEADRTQMIEGVQAVRDLVAQRAFRGLAGAEIGSADARSTGEILNLIRSMSETDYHPCGTCAMGRVVDAECRVLGVEGLRVVDASVLPRILSANLNAPVQMIAARVADFILGNPQLEAAKAQFHFDPS